MFMAMRQTSKSSMLRIVDGSSKAVRLAHAWFSINPEVTDASAPGGSAPSAMRSSFFCLVKSIEKTASSILLDFTSLFGGQRLAFEALTWGDLHRRQTVLWQQEEKTS